MATRFRDKIAKTDTTKGKGLRFSERATLLSKAKDVPGPVPENHELPEGHHQYFDLSENKHKLVPLEHIVPEKPPESQPKSVENAMKFMHMAKKGETDKRKPISVVRQGGKYHVKDGNATFGAAHRLGWSNLPVHVMEEGEVSKATPNPPDTLGLPSPGMPSKHFADKVPAAIHGSAQTPGASRIPATPHARHRATGPDATDAFTHEEMNLPKKAWQKHNDLPRLMKEAGEHKEWQDNIIDRGQGLSAKLGLHVVEGRDLTEDDFKEAHKKGGLVQLAPLKGSNDGGKRLQQKAASDKNKEEDGSPGFRKLRDLSRATIAVPHKDDIPHVVEHLRNAGMQFGEKPEDKFEHPSPEGYSDIQASPVHPNGHIGELQLHTLDMLHAKHFRGHKLYEEIRDVPADANGQPKDPADAEKLGRLRDESKELYGKAKEAQAGRKPSLHKGVRMEKAVAGGGSGKGSDAHRGFYRWGHHPVVLLSKQHFPLMYNGKKFVVVRDLGDFHHEAHKISEGEFKQLVAKFHENQRG